MVRDQERAPLAPYRKVLWLRQPYPDNHVDASFLSDLQRNVNVHPASLPALLRQTVPITQHLSCTFVFLAVFIRLSHGTLSSSTLLVACAVLSAALRLWSWLIGEATSLFGTTNSGGGGGDRATTTTATAAPLIPLVALYLLAPALKTLTRATTSDSIWALSGTLFALNALLADYRAIPLSSTLRWSRDRAAPTTSPATTTTTTMARRAALPSTISLTAALSGSTVLASRLSSNSSVFSLLLFATLWFGPLPLLRSSLPFRPTLALTTALAGAALVLLRSTHTGATPWAAAVLLGTSVGAPLVRGWLVIRYKDRLSGPWDAAVPKVGGGGEGG
ncbi:uncharacterized protein RHOBADRAFT_46366 [Rhodotorula graminis WP1]|uniref:GPI2-domain-containing protein n=1 Tax=Rhodotorula graminis (strain WP1) TaxID=578459 RepID=A0A0P9ITN1_RHOGW|nr:uncharacterized protein RHOBADRAFT_46366 [Rhodotorula graminis WP1]KPV72771.1 hypothetical protein RHOBADRAFT_46366 [Rhodotorula graminis WP1]